MIPLCKATFQYVSDEEEDPSPRLAFKKWVTYPKTLPATATCLAKRRSIVGWMFFTPYTPSSVVLAVGSRSVVDRSVLDRSSVTKRGVDEGVDSSVMGEVSVVSAVLLPLLVPELLLLGLELLDEGRGSVT